MLLFQFLIGIIPLAVISASVVPPLPGPPLHPISKRAWSLNCDPLALPSTVIISPNADPSLRADAMTVLCTSPSIGCYCDGPDTLCWPRDSPPPTSPLPQTSQPYIEHAAACFASCECWDVGADAGPGKENREPRPPPGVPSWSAYFNGGMPPVRDRTREKAGGSYEGCLDTGGSDVCTQDGDCCRGAKCVPHRIAGAALVFGLESIVHVGGCLAFS